jgi:DnaJ-class molecular chaperone
MNNNIIDFDEKIDLYKILEINKNSSEKEIKKAWKKLALKYHPDKNNNITSDKFIKIKYAYDILSNKDSKEKYDNQLNINNIFDINILLNLKNYLINFFDSTEMDKIINLLLHKKESNNLFDTIIINYYDFNTLFKKLTDIVITIDFNLNDIWMCNSKIIKYDRYTKKYFEEIIYPIDFEQIYENEGEELIINNILYRGDLIIKINIINTFYNNENYCIFNDELYILINKKRIINNKFEILFLDNNKYKFNIKKLKQINNQMGELYIKKNFGFPKFLLNNIIDKKNKINIEELESIITYSNLFFIIVI